MTTGQTPGAEAQVQQHSETIRKTVASYSYQLSVMDVNRQFDQLDPGAISDACRAWKRAADELQSLADDIKARVAQPLSTVYSDKSSPDSQKQLQTAEATARALANDCLQMAHSTDYAAQYAQWYKDNRPSISDSLLTGAKGLVTGNGFTAGADAAVQHLTNFLSRYNEVIQTLPDSVERKWVPSLRNDFTPTDGPSVSGPGGAGAGGTYGGHGGGASAPGVGTSSAGSGSGTGIHATNLPHPGAGGSGLGSGSSLGGGAGAGGLGAGASGVGAGDPYAAGSSLAGTGLGGGVSAFDPSALGSAASGLGGGTGLGASGLGAGLGAAGLGAAGLGGGLGAGRSGAGLGGGMAGFDPEGMGASGGVPAGGLGAGRLGAGVGPGGVGGAGGAPGEGTAAGAGGRGSGMMPMHGGQGEGEEERQRSTWLTEDDDVWGTDGDVPPPVINR